MSSTVAGLAVDSVGRVIFADDSDNSVRRLKADGSTEVIWKSESDAYWYFKAGIAVGPKDEVYVVTRENKIYKIENGKVSQTWMSDEGIRDLVVLNNGKAYACVGHELWHVLPDGKLTRADLHFDMPWSVHANADQSQLIVSDSIRRHAYSMTVMPDGTLANMQEYAHLHRSDEGGPGTSQMAADTLGRMYFCTEIGIQVTDQLGRVHLILDMPAHDDHYFGGITFGSKDMNMLYVSHGYRIYRRKINAIGVSPSQKPVKPPRPRL